VLFRSPRSWTRQRIGKYTHVENSWRVLYSLPGFQHCASLLIHDDQLSQLCLGLMFASVTEDEWVAIHPIIGMLVHSKRLCGACLDQIGLTESEKSDDDNYLFVIFFGLFESEQRRRTTTTAMAATIIIYLLY